MPPLISICLPTRNVGRFLNERLESIRHQTCADWEVVAVDGFSDDGTWERLQAWAATEPRVHAKQAAPAGIYSGLNDCLREASGEFVYIATADDTMTPDCLGQMVAALDAHPECELAACCLSVIDENGRPMPTRNWDEFPAARLMGDRIHRPHIRPAPRDGLLHLAVGNVYTSLTQLLVRRRLFDRIGLFDGRFGPAGDFEWGMRASLVANTVHVPAYLATWRIHPAQATGEWDCSLARQRIVRMARVAWSRARRLGAALPGRWTLERLLRPWKRDVIWWGMREHTSVMGRLAFLANALAVSPAEVARYVTSRLTRQPYELIDQASWVKPVLLKLGVPPIADVGGGCVTP